METGSSSLWLRIEQKPPPPLILSINGRLRHADSIVDECEAMRAFILSIYVSVRLCAGFVRIWTRCCGSEREVLCKHTSTLRRLRQSIKVHITFYHTHSDSRRHRTQLHTQCLGGLWWVGMVKGVDDPTVPFCCAISSETFRIVALRAFAT